MIYALLTLFAALAAASVAAWFSIVGIMTIYAGALMNAALVMGVVLEFAKLVTISWVYRNWETASWKIRIPLVYFVLALMLITSAGVFGFLTKSHLDQTSSTVDNGAKIERLDQQIARETATIAEYSKSVDQLNATIDSYIGKDRADRAVIIQRRQASQRKELQGNIDASQAKIDTFSDEKFKLTSEVRALQLEVGPIRYIAELFYAEGGDDAKKIESAVTYFTLLIVSTLDPLAVILLIAANHTLLRLRDGKDKKEILPECDRISEAARQSEHIKIGTMGDTDDPLASEYTSAQSSHAAGKDTAPHPEGKGGNSYTCKAPMDIPVAPLDEARPEAKSEEIVIGDIDEKEEAHIQHDSGSFVSQETNIENDAGMVDVVDTPTEPTETTSQDNKKVSKPDRSVDTPESVHAVVAAVLPIQEVLDFVPPPVVLSPKVSRVSMPVPEQSSVLRELFGTYKHFTPTKVNEENSQTLPPDGPHSMDGNTIFSTVPPEKVHAEPAKEDIASSGSTPNLIEPNKIMKHGKYPKVLSWLTEFRGD
jgi:hypothetical protein